MVGGPDGGADLSALPGVADGWVCEWLRKAHASCLHRIGSALPYGEHFDGRFSSDAVPDGDRRGELLDMVSSNRDWLVNDASSRDRWGTLTLG
jgi:hypothetical protein